MKKRISKYNGFEIEYSEPALVGGISLYQNDYDGALIKKGDFKLMIKLPDKNPEEYLKDLIKRIYLR